MPVTETIPLHETARKRYLNYALSVITSRALPDIRDGLKPVQRRILYAMFDSLNLYPNKRHRKSATVVGECFVEGTLVATEEGLREVQDIQRGDRVHTESGVRPVTECFEMPSRPLIDLELENGATNTVTRNQPMRVVSDGLQLEWKEASDVKAGDWLVLKKNTPWPNQQVALPAFQGRSLQCTPKLAYLLGHFMADGWISADYGKKNRLRLGLCSMDRTVIEYVRTCCEQTFGKAPSLETNGDGFYIARIQSKAINEYLAEVFDLTAELCAHSKFIPDQILQSPEPVVWAFVAGLFDGDGSLGTKRTRARYVSTSTKLIDQLQVLLQHLGIPSNQSLLHSNPNPCHVLTVRGDDAKGLVKNTPFQRETLQSRAEEILESDTYQSKFDRIPNGGETIFQELSERHEGGGWYRDVEGNAFRQGITYTDGTKIRYSNDRQERPLSFSQVEEWGILSKLQRIGSPLFETLEYFLENDLFFVQVSSVKEAPPQKTYDLQVAADHNFVANGMVAHNCMGKYHPHGDKAIYDAMVRMAQSFSLRAPLVDGHGNFGSIDGDNAAAMRYTEAKLQPLAMEMLEGLRDDTVDYRDNFDGTLEEPIVLPSRVPNLLVNGASGIAVGMATNIPPHNLGEVVDAALRMIEEPDVSTRILVRDHVQGPDFPTGGRLLNTREELAEIYETGRGTIEMRGAYRKKGKTRAIIESVPYGVDKSKIVEEIADHIAEENVPQLSNVRDESTDDVRIVLELKRGSDTEAALAYLYKHTKLQKRFHVNLTCLVPTEEADVKAPRQVDLRTILRHFLDFRMEVVTRRLRNELEELEARIHILEGFETIFDALDEAIKIIRASKNKADAAQRLMHRFRLDEDQTDAILETRLYKLSQMEIEAIREELEEKRARAEEIRRLLDDEEARWGIVEDELREVRDDYADERRSTIAGPDADIEYTEEDYIVDEDVHVIVTRDGWVKRQGTYSDLDAIRTRDGDEVGWVLPGSTRATVGFFTNYGTCYTVRIAEIPSTTGYGDPVQKLFSFDDGEHVVGVVSFDDRVLPDPFPEEPDEQGELFDPNGNPDLDAPDHPYVVAITKAGQATRFTLNGFIEPSISTGRKYMRLDDGDEVVRAHLARGNENVCLASHDGRALIFPIHQVSVYKGPAKGVRAIRLEGDDRVLDFTLSTRARQGLTVETNNGREEIVRTTKFDVTNRGAKGTLVIKRGYFAEVFPEPVEVTLNGES